MDIKVTQSEYIIKHKLNLWIIVLTLTFTDGFKIARLFFVPIFLGLKVLHHVMFQIFLKSCL